jgi:hypothetical protein
MPIPAILETLGTMATSKAMDYGLSKLLGGSSSSSTMLPYSPGDMEIDPQNFLNKYMDIVSPIQDDFYKNLEEYQQKVNSDIDLLSGKTTNKDTRQEFKDSFSSNMKTNIGLLNSGFMTPEEIESQMKASAVDAGWDVSKKINGNTITGWANILQNRANADRPLNFAQGVTSMARQILGRAPTEKELKQYTPENGYPTIQAVANSMSSSLEGRRRNPGAFTSALGGLMGGVRITELKESDVQPYQPQFNNNPDSTTGAKVNNINRSSNKTKKDNSAFGNANAAEFA